MKPAIHIKRIYEKYLAEDGCRVFVDRLWPRGIAKESLQLDEWAKDLAPSTELRKWFGHSPDLWPEFQKKYTAELEKNEAIGDFIRRRRQEDLITLLFSGKDTEHTHAIVLQQYLQQCYAQLSDKPGKTNS